MKTTSVYAFNQPEGTDNILASINAFNSNFAILDTFDTIIEKQVGTNGYIKYKSGLLIQWGSATTGADVADHSKNFDIFYSSMQVNFPVPFKTVCFYTGAMQSSNVGAWVSRVSNTLVAGAWFFSGWDNCTNGRPFKWFAIGI